MLFRELEYNVGMEDGGNKEQLAASPDFASERPLKKKKSLTRLFSSSSKKSPRSRPQSREEDPCSSPTPSLPATFKTLPAEPPQLPQSPRVVSSSLDWFRKEPIEGNSSVSPPRKEKDFVHAVTSLDMESYRTPLVRATEQFESASASRKNSLAIDEEGITRTANVVQIVQDEKPTIYHAPTFPATPKRTKTGLRMPSSFAALPRGRGSSVTITEPERKSKAPSVLPLLSRPSTAGGEYNPKPTGKRKPSAVGSDTTIGFAPKDDDMPPSPQRPWQATYSYDEVRSSFRSALTTNSSRLETTSNERSSVLTRGTSISESTIDLQSRPVSKAGGMTVDDAIDMYAAGFTDNEDFCVNTSKDQIISEEERRRSKRIEEAINESIGGFLIPPRSMTGESTSSTAIMSGNAFKNITLQPPPILPSTSTRDQYGFLKASHHITVKQYETWSEEYLPSQGRRARKWSSYMRDHGLPTHLPSQFPPRSTKTQRFIRKGIPPAWRGEAWFFYAGGRSYLDRHSGLYPSLVSRSEAELPLNDKESIERDLHRTFPDNIHFKPNLSRSSDTQTPEPPLLTSLRRLLRAFALHSPKIGYCQSLNFLAGLLLLFLPEEKAFWMLHLITAIYLPGTHEVSLEGANIDLWVLMVALKSTQPNIWAKVGGPAAAGDDLHGSARLPPISLCTTSWFMSLFIGTLPIETVLRVWDVLFYEGSKTLFRVALAIFKLGEQRIRSVSDSMELFQVVQGLPRGMVDASAFMTAVCKRGGLGSDWVEARRYERRDWYAQERAISADDVNTKVAGEEDIKSKQGVEELGRRSSAWRRGKKKAFVPSKPPLTQAPSRPADVSEVGKKLLSL